MSPQSAPSWPTAPEGQERLTHKPTVTASIRYWTGVLEAAKQRGDWECEKTAFSLIESLKERL